MSGDFKVIDLNDAGLPNRFGGDDLDKINRILNGEDLSVTIEFDNAVIFNSGKLQLHDISEDNIISIITSEEGSDWAITIPILGGNREMLFTDLEQEITNKDLDGGDNTFTNIPNSALVQITDKDKLPNDVVYDDDSRLTDNRDPNAHASSHSEGQADAVDITNLDGYSGVDTQFLSGDGTWQTPAGSGTGAPDDVQYVTLATSAALSAERVLTAGTGLSLSDAGANSTVTLSIDGTVVTDDDSRLTDDRDPNPHAVSHQLNGDDELEIDWDQLDNVPETFPPATHNHDADYSAINHDHDADYSAITHHHDADYADIDHDHDEDYSDINHHHDADYSAINHHHDADYSAINHHHDATYSNISHDHDEDYSAINHNHDEDYADINHDHDSDYADITHASEHITGGDDIIPVATTTSTGLSPILSDDDTEFLDGKGNWSVPSSGSTINSIDDIPDVNTSSEAPENNDVLTWSAAENEWVPAAPPGASGGEDNTAANVGDGDGEIFRDKTGTTINLRTLAEGSNITISTDTNEITISATDTIVDTLADLTEDVNITTPQDEQILEYDNGTSKWVNVAHDHSAEFSAISHDHDSDYSAINHHHDSDYADINHHHDADYADISHNHAAGDITSGELAVARGGLNKSSITQDALLKGGATNTYSEITVGSEDHVLAVVSGTPAWKSLNSELTGTAEADGNNSTVEFIVPHDLGSIPFSHFIQCYSHSIPLSWTIDEDDFTVTFDEAPESGTDNVKFVWRVIE